MFVEFAYETTTALGARARVVLTEYIDQRESAYVVTSLR